MSQMIDKLEREARKPDYGARYYKPATVLALIAELRKRQSMCEELELARRVADAAAAYRIAKHALWLVVAADGFQEDAALVLIDAGFAAWDACDAAVREYRAHVEARAVLRSPPFGRALEKVGEMEAVSSAE